MNSKELLIPDGWRVKEVIDNRVILEEIDAISRLKTWEECYKALGKGEVILSDSSIAKGFNLSDPKSTTMSIVPENFGRKVLALCRLLVCRNAWWKQLGWKPDWGDGKNKKYAISITKNNPYCYDTYAFNAILAFPTREIRDQFLESFGDLIEEAKELL